MLMLHFITNNGYLITTTTMSLLGRNITEIVEYKLKEKLADFFATPRLVQWLQCGWWIPAAPPTHVSNTAVQTKAIKVWPHGAASTLLQ